jgi:gliding motility-associated-like protein
MGKLIAVLISIFLLFGVKAQDFSNKGKDFYLCFPNHVPNAATNLATLSIYITSDKASSGTITMGNNAFSSTFNIAANTIQEIVIPHSSAHINNSESGAIIQKSIRVKVDIGKPAVVVYAQQWAGARSAATLVLPTTVLGKKYHAFSYTQNGTDFGTYLARSQFQIIAVDDNTTVSITPRLNGVAQSPFTINLPKQGDMYQYQATQDLTGTYIESISSGTGTCNPIAFFSGSSALTMSIQGCNNGQNSFDPLWQQMYPISTWGKNFGFIPFEAYPNGVPYRVMAAEDNTIVSFDGNIVANLNKGDIYPNTFNSTPPVLTAPTSITANKPIAVAQYAQRSACAGGSTSAGNRGDPDMVILNPIEQNISDINVFSSANQAITQRFINVLIKSAAIPSFRINGNAPSAAFNAMPTLPGYSYLREQLTQNIPYRLKADSGFNAIAYGWGNFESYAYSAGTNVIDLLKLPISENPDTDSTLRKPVGCVGKLATIYQTYAYKPTQLIWDFNVNPGQANPFPCTAASYTDNNPQVYDSIQINGIWRFRYKNNVSCTINTPGVYSYTVKSLPPTTSNECPGLQEDDYDLTIYDNPEANFNWTHSGCFTDTVRFFDISPNASNSDGETPYKWKWTFHDNTTDTLKNPKKLYTGAGSFTVKLGITNRAGCKSPEVTKNILMSATPIADFNISTPRCIGKPITFTTNTSLASGTLQKWVWEWGDGSLNDTALSNAPITHTFNTVGPFNVRHTGISTTGCAGLPKAVSLVVNVNPIANFDLPANVCLPVGAANFNNTTTIADGTLPTYVWNFGDATPTTTTTNGIHNYSAVGPFNVILQATSNNGCIHDTIKIFNNIRPRPTSGFTNVNEVCIKDSIQFTTTSVGNGGTIINYFWKFSDGTTSSVQNPKKKWTTSGPKTIQHWIETNQGCISDTTEKTIYVNASPVANFNFANTGRCARKPITFTDASTFSDGTITTWEWNFGDATATVNTTTNATQFHTYTTEGTYTVKLVVKTNKGCISDTLKKDIIITATPNASFIPPGGICLPTGFAQFTNNTTISDGSINTVTYNWNFGDATANSTAISPSHNFPGTGPYNVTLTATSTVGCVDDSVQTISNIFAEPQGSFTANAEVCINNSISFTSTSSPISGIIAEHYWDYGVGAGFVLGTATPTFTYTTTGNKTIRHYIKTSNGCISTTATRNVFVNQLPTASFSFSTIVCEKDSITFTSTSVPNNGSIVEWTWDWNDASPVQVVTNSNPLKHLFATAGNYNVKLTVKTDKGCISTQISNLVIANSKPVPNFDLPANVCLPIGATTFNNTTTIVDGTLAQTTYVWNFGDATPTTTTTNGIHTYSAVGPFNVKLQAASSKGCIDTITKVFNNIRPRPTASFTNNTEVCVSDSLQFTSTSIGNGGNVVEYGWDFGDGTTSTLANPKKKWVTGGFKTVTHFIKTDQGCYSDTARKTTIYVNQLPTSDFNFSTPQCENKNITFTSTAVPNDGNITNWTWNFGDGTPVVNATTGVAQQHSYTSTSTFNVSLSVTTDKGCVNALPQVKPVTINPNPVVKMYLPEICLDDATAQFSDSSTIADGTENQFTYLWNFGDFAANISVANPNTATIKNPTHKFNTAAVYNMSLEITSNKGCVTKKDTTFTVNGSTPISNFTVQNANGLCSNKDVTIQNASTVNFGSVTKVEIYWDWANNPLLKTTDENPSPGKLYNYDYPDFGIPASKTYTVRFIAYSGGVCLNAIDKPITVLASPTISFAPIPDICQENTATILPQAQETTGILGIGVFSGPGIVNNNNFDPSVAGIGAHTIRYTFNATNGCAAFKEQIINVNPTPNANAGPDRVVLEGGSVNLLGTSSTNNVTYLWSPNTPVSLNNTALAQPTASPVNDTYYTLEVTSDEGCIAKDIVFVKVLKAPKVPNAFSPNGDGINDKWDIEYLDTYPGAIIEVFNIYGQKVFRSVGYSKAWEGTYNGKPLPIGTYYYIIEPQNGRKAITGYVGIIR